MKDFLKRLIGVLVFLGIMLVVFSLTISFAKRTKSYKYLTYENEWGKSNNCHLDETQVSICEINNSVVSVKQYYEVDY
jgi:Fe2+ transport system protein B